MSPHHFRTNGTERKEPFGTEKWIRCAPFPFFGYIYIYIYIYIYLLEIVAFVGNNGIHSPRVFMCVCVCLFVFSSIYV
jgi:hypothetical protein